MRGRSPTLLLLLVFACLAASARAFIPANRGVKPSEKPTLFSLQWQPTTSSLAAAKKAVAKQSQNILTKRVFPAIASVTSTIYAALAELSLLQKALFASFFFVGFWAGRVPPFWEAYRDVMAIPSRCFGPNASVLRGRAVSVSDGDTIRFYHTPMWWQKPPEKIKVSQVALPIRICSIDTPETAKFGKSGQPFGKEAKEALKELVEGKIVKVRLLQKDQYGRAVAQVMSGAQHVDEYMLKKGLAEVYVGGGAVYGPKGLDGYLELQEEAKKKKEGIWSQKNRESAAEYKKRTKE